MAISHDDILSSVDLLGNNLRHGDTVAILVKPRYDSSILEIRGPILDEPCRPEDMGVYDTWRHVDNAISTKELIEQGFKKSEKSCRWYRISPLARYEGEKDDIYRGFSISYATVHSRWTSSNVDREFEGADAGFEEQIAKIHDNGIGIIRGVIYRMRQVKKDKVNLLQLKVEGGEDWMWVDTLNEAAIKVDSEMSDEELIAKFAELQPK